MAKQKQPKIKWLPKFGTFAEEADGTIRFEGGDDIVISQGGDRAAPVLNMVCNKRLGNGSVSATFQFEDVAAPATAAIIVRDYPERSQFLIAGLGGGTERLYLIRTFNGNTWDFPVHISGDRASLRPKQEYKVEVQVIGSRLSMFVNEVQVTSLPLPVPLPASQVGLWFQGRKQILARNYLVSSGSLSCFVVMQFTPPYNELFSDVIKPVCGEFDIVAERADDVYGPGIILQDIVGRLIASSIIIAEVSPANQNVFFEVGYAFALNKPMILIAERGVKLPFDISGMRTLFYENSISGKAKIEAELRRHLRAIMIQGGISTMAP